MNNWKNLRKQVKNEKPDPRLVELELDLKSHDWYWYMTDDPYVRAELQARTSNLYARARSLGEAGERLYSKYCKQK